MPLSKPVFPEAFVDVAVFLPDILAVAVSDIVGPSTDIDFLVFDECLLADAMFYVFDLLTFVNGVAFFTIYFWNVFTGLDAHSMLLIVLEEPKEVCSIRPSQFTKAVFKFGYRISLALVKFAITKIFLLKLLDLADWNFSDFPKPWTFIQWSICGWRKSNWATVNHRTLSWLDWRSVCRLRRRHHAAKQRTLYRYPFLSVFRLRLSNNPIFLTQLLYPFWALLQSVHLFLVLTLSFVNPADHKIKIINFPESLLFWQILL